HGYRTILEMLGIEDDEVAASVFVLARGHAHQVTLALGSGGRLRREAALGERGARACIPEYLALRAVVEAHIASIRLARVGRIGVARAEEAVAVGLGVVAVVLARQCALPGTEALHLVTGGTAAVHVGRDARDVARAPDRIPGRAVQHRHEGEGIRFRHLDVDVDAAAIIPGAHDVRGAALGTFEPADVAAVAVAAEGAEEGLAARLPGPVDAA